MPGRIRQEDIAAVRERSPIVEVAGEYLQLRPAGGGSFKGLCPFHDEKTPSFNVTPGKELYYCFSCNAGGDVIRFVQSVDNLTFTEAVERLAARTGIELGRIVGRLRHTSWGPYPNLVGGRVEGLETLVDPDATDGRRVWLSARVAGTVRLDWKES